MKFSKLFLSSFLLLIAISTHGTNVFADNAATVSDPAANVTAAPAASTLPAAPDAHYTAAITALTKVIPSLSSPKAKKAACSSACTTNHSFLGISYAGSCQSQTVQELCTSVCNPQFPQPNCLKTTVIYQ